MKPTRHQPIVWLLYKKGYLQRLEVGISIEKQHRAATHLLNQQSTKSTIATVGLIQRVLDKHIIDDNKAGLHIQCPHIS